MYCTSYPIQQRECRDEHRESATTTGNPVDGSDDACDMGSDPDEIAGVARRGSKGDAFDTADTRCKTDSAQEWQSAVNCTNEMGNRIYRSGCYAGSCGKHLKRCFARSVYLLLWLWQKQPPKPAVCLD
jgi:hypothetical protein